MKALFVSRDYTLRNDGGCAVTRRNLLLLKELSTSVEEFIIPTPTMMTRLQNVILNSPYGSTSSLVKNMEQLMSVQFDIIFFDGSIYGGYLKKFAEKGYNTICFFHNVESKYYRDKYDLTHRIVDKVMIKYIEHCESFSCKYADYRIVLNERDSLGLFNQYGCSSDLILPTSFDPIEEQYLVSKVNTIDEGKFLLFVGSNFFANVEAVMFLIKEIAPYVDYKILIIGSVCEVLNNINIPKNVILKGVVDDLLPYYVNASCIINPVFSGSGMKTKTIEALRYGKYLLGTTECFEGIPAKEIDKIGVVCNTRDEFIHGIENLNCQLVNHSVLNVFNTYFSTKSQLERLKTFLIEKKLI